MPTTALKIVARSQLSFAAPWPVLAPPSPSRARRRPTRAAADRNRVSQCAFVLTIRPPGEITPPMISLEALLIKLSRIADEVPNNPALGERAGGWGRSTVDRSLKRMHAMGIIRLEIEAKRRRFWVAETNLFTGWGEARIGHAPYSSNPKGTPPPPPQRAANSPPLPPQCGWLPGPETPTPRQCQMPMWGDHQKPTFIYCGAPAVRRKSYCECHLVGLALSEEVA